MPRVGGFEYYDWRDVGQGFSKGLDYMWKGLAGTTTARQEAIEQAAKRELGVATKAAEAGVPFTQAAPAGMFPGPGVQNIPTAAGRMAGPYRETLGAVSDVRRQQRELETQKQQEDLLNTKQARKFAQIDRAEKTMNWFTKLIKDGSLNPTAKQTVVAKMNEINRTVLGATADIFNIADDSGDIQTKWQGEQLRAYQEEYQSVFDETPSEGNYQRASLGLQKLKQQGIPVDIMQDALNKRMAEVRKRTAPQRVGGQMVTPFLGGPTVAEDITGFKSAQYGRLQELYNEYKKGKKKPLSFYDWWKQEYKPLDWRGEMMRGMFGGGATDPGNIF